MGFEYEDPEAAKRRQLWVTKMQEAMAEAAWKPRPSGRQTPRSLSIESALIDALDTRISAYYREQAEDAARAEARARLWGKITAVVLVAAAILIAWLAEWRLSLGRELGPPPTQPKQAMPAWEVSPVYIPNWEVWGPPLALTPVSKS